MRIKTLKLENFRQFKGVNEITFSCDPKKNVTVILGNNTFGKTTLLQAFHWCLYDKVNFEQRSDFLLNYELAEEMKNGESANVEVEMKVVHGEVEYTITRTQNYLCVNDYPMRQDYNEDKKPNAEKKYSKVKVFYKIANGETLPVRASKIEEVINDILPENLASYFFFDTERVSNISNRKDVSVAVKGLLGLSIIDNALKHLGDRAKKITVIGRFYGKMDTEGDDKSQKLLQQIHDAEEKRARIAEQIEECKTQITKYEEKKESLNAILRENEVTSKLQSRKEKLERALLEEKQNLAKQMENFLKTFNACSIMFFAQPLLKKVDEILQTAKFEDENFIDLNKTVIQKILNSGRCICGRKFKQDDSAYKHLEKALNTMPQESMSNGILRYREKVNTFSNLAAQTFSNIERDFSVVLNSRKKICELEDDIESISEQISGKENVQLYTAELENISRKLLELNNKKDRLNQEDGIQRNEQERFQNAYDEIIATFQANQEIMNFMDYAEKIREVLDAEYKNKEAFIREKLEIEVNKIFAQMYSGKRRVVIDDSYNVRLFAAVSKTEIESGESEGASRVKNFAFIAGLVALAKNKIVIDNEKKQINLSEEPYPLVMDAPFSNADEVHTTNISEILPKIADQVIMFVMQKDWKYAEPVLRERIGKQYFLEKISETLTKIK